MAVSPQPDRSLRLLTGDRVSQAYLSRPCVWPLGQARASIGKALYPLLLVTAPLGQARFATVLALPDPHTRDGSDYALAWSGLTGS